MVKNQKHRFFTVGRLKEVVSDGKTTSSDFKCKDSTDSRSYKRQASVNIDDPLIVILCTTYLLYYYFLNVSIRDGMGIPRAPTAGLSVHYHGSLL